jgi:PAS domain S-box-containing protein
LNGIPMSWLQTIIDNGPDDTITVPDDGGRIPRNAAVIPSSRSSERPYPAHLQKTSAQRPEPPAGTGKSILIVEDEGVVAHDIAETLKSLGYAVTGIAKSGEDALEMVKASRPDLVLMDIHLATAMDGIEAAEKIHHLCDIPVIYLTAYADKPLLDRTKITEPFGYIIKPYDERELQSTIEIAFHKHTQDLLVKKAYGELEQRVFERTAELETTNRALAESESRYRNLFEGVPIGIYRTTPSGKILDINPALVSLLGYPNREMLMNVSVSDIYADPEDRTRWLDLIGREGIVREFEVQFRKYNGTIIRVHDSGKAVFDDHGRVLYYYGNVEDITERLRIEEDLRTHRIELETQAEELRRTQLALEVSLNRYHDLYEFAPLGYLTFNRKALITDVNRAGTGLFWTYYGDIINHGLGRFIAPESQDEWARFFENVQNSASKQRCNLIFRLEDGSRFPARIEAVRLPDSSNGGEILVAITDITDIRQAEDALRTSEQRYRNVVEDQTEFICRFSPDGKLTFINEAYCNYFGLNREECIGTRHSVVLFPDDVYLMKNHLASLIPENPVAWLSHRIVLPSGKVRWQRWSDRAIFDPEGNVSEYQSVGRDITLQTEAEIQLENYKETLEQEVRDRTSELSRTNQKLKKEIEDRKKIQKKLTISSNDKDLLLREVHHRVKNNLQLIIGLIDMTKTRAHEPMVISTLTDIMAKVQTMGLIHTRLYESKRFDKINMKRQVQDLVGMLSGFYDHDHLDISTTIDCADIYLPVDKAIPCALALNEIISNIHKHAFRGRRNGLVEISSSVREDMLRFVIQDNGVGLPSGFDIEKSNRLGLKLMRTLVEQQLHGDVQITGKNGTEVVIEFCIRQEEVEYGPGTGS